MGWTEEGSSLQATLTAQLRLPYPAESCLLPVYPSQDSNLKLSAKGSLLSWEEDVRGGSSRGPRYMGSDPYW